MKKYFLLLLLLPALAWGFNLKLLDDYSGPSYDFRDDFSDTRAAGSVNGTLSTSGHTRTVVDTESKISITGGLLTVESGKAAPAYGDPGILWNAAAGFPRVAGQMFIQDLTITDVTAGLEFGWDANTSGVLGASAARIVSDTYLPYETGTGLGSVATPADATNYKVAVINRAVASTGAFHLLKTTTGEWKLLGRTQSNNTATVYPANANYSAAYTSSFVRLPSMRWMPSPILNHGFATAITPTDGTGIAETTGLGSGGSGVVMTQANNTWAVSGAKAVNSPVAGGELFDDTGFAAACDAGAGHWTCEAGWDNAGGVAVATNPVYKTIVQNGKTVVGNWYQHQFDIVSISGGGAKQLIGGGTPGAARTTTGTFINTGRAASTANSGLSDPYGGATVLTADNISVKQLTLSELFLTAPLSTSHVVASADLTITAGTQIGLVTNLDSAASPANFLIHYNDGTTCKTDVAVAGVYTNVISAACTYSAGKPIVAVYDAGSVRLYYNSALIGTATLSAGQITAVGSNLLAGLFSTSPLSSADNLVIYDRGVSGCYNFLSQFTN